VCITLRLSSWPKHVTKDAKSLTLRTPWSRVLLEKLTGPQLVKKFPAFKEPDGLSPHLQVPATCPYPEPDQSGPTSHITPSVAPS
jgi:hypothetical protein